MAKSGRGWTLPALLGGAGLIVGAFAPAAIVDYYGEVSLHDVAETQALLVVLAGAAALVGAVVRRPGWIGPAALVAWIGVLLPLIRNWLAPRDEGFFDRLGRAATESVGDALGEIALEMTKLSWGGAPLLGGLLLVTVAAWRVRR